MESNQPEKASVIIGKAIIDLGKLIFAGLVIASIFNTDVDKYLLILFGVLGCIGFLFVGTYLVVKKPTKKK